MTHLFGCICNQAQGVTEALEPVRAVLVAPAPIDRWGFGYVQSGEVLLSRRPKVARDETVDFFAALHKQRTDYAIVCASPPDGLSGQENTQPFRFRKWLFAQDGVLPVYEAIQNRLLEHVPAYLRRNIQGRTGAEHVFHVFLSMLHDAGAIEDVDLDPSIAVRALRDTGAFVSALIQQAGAEPRLGNIIATNARTFLAVRMDEPLFLRWVKIPGRSAGTELRAVIAVSRTGCGDEPPGEGFEAIPRRTVLVVTRDIATRIVQLDF